MFSFVFFIFTYNFLSQNALYLFLENITHSLISEGLVSVRDAVGNSKEGAELKALEAAAKAAKKGKWDPNADPQVFSI